MYLKRLYRYNKTGFIIFLLMLMAFIIINYKQGAVATPFYLYGMYSGPRQNTDTQKIYQLSVNGRQLDLKDISFAERDLLLLSPANYQQQKLQNPVIFHTMKGLFSKAGIGSMMNEKKYINSTTDDDFKNWYSSLIQNIVVLPFYKIILTSRYFTWKDNRLQPISEPKNELSIVIVE